jgi:hypothetical protein
MEPKSNTTEGSYRSTQPAVVGREHVSDSNATLESPSHRGFFRTVGLAGGATAHSRSVWAEIRKEGCIRWLSALLFLALIGTSASAYSQQFNSDNWWVLPHGVGTGVATVGEKYNTMYLGYGFAPKWEADIGVFTYEEDQASGTAAHYSTTAYVKRLLYENQSTPVN